MARVTLMILTVFVFGGCCCSGNVTLRTESPQSGPPVVDSDPRGHVAAGASLPSWYSRL